VTQHLNTDYKNLKKFSGQKKYNVVLLHFLLLNNSYKAINYLVVCINQFLL